MKTAIQVFAAGLVLGAAGTAANAVVILTDNFDTYGDQAQFQAAWAPVGSQPTATLSTAQSRSAPNSVHVPTSADTASSQRNGRSVTETGTPSADNQIVWSFDFYDEA